CALVLGDIDSLRELWDGAALFVDPRDPAAIAVAIEQLTHDEVLRNDLAWLARVRAGRYTPRTFGDAWLALYETLLAPSREAASRFVPLTEDEGARARP
ncbi:MAG TPA: hypothetical protein VF698_21535, partial [Thermoanaerobaculia bacterium]